MAAAFEAVDADGVAADRSAFSECRARGAAPPHRLQPPAHRPLRPRRHLRQRARRPRRRRPGRHLPARPRDLRRQGRWEIDRGPQDLAYDFWWHLGYDTMITSEWGTPNMVEDGVNPELLLGNQYGHQLHVWDLRQRTPPAGARPRAPSTRWCSSCGRRTTRRKAYGFVGVVVSTADLSAPRSGCGSAPDDGSVRGREGDHDPGRAGRARPAARRSCSPSAPCRRWSPTSTCRVDDQVLYVSCWGTGELKQYDVSDPLQPARDRLGAPRRHRRARAAPGRRRRSTAARRWSRSAATAGAST